MKSYITNKNDIKKYLGGFAGDDKELSRLLFSALYGPLQHYAPCLHDDPDQTLRPTFNRHSHETRLHFVPDEDLNQKIEKITNWLKEAQKLNAPWIHTTDGKGKPFKLKHIFSLQAALQMVATPPSTGAPAPALPMSPKLKEETERGDVEIVHKFENGFVLAQIKTEAALFAEGEQMGNCWRHPEGGGRKYYAHIRNKDQNWAYYSLRDAKNKSHATISHDVKNGVITECLARYDQPPLNPALDVLIPWFEENGFDVNEDPLRTGLIKQDEKLINIFDLRPDFVLKRALSFELRKQQNNHFNREINMPCLALDDLDLHNSNTSTLAPLTRAEKNLCLKKTKVTDLGTLRYVGGDLNAFNIPLSSFGALEYVGGDLHLWGTQVSSSGSSRIHVEGNVNVCKTKMTNLDCFSHIGGNIHTDLGTFDDLEEAKAAFHAHFGPKEIRRIESEPPPRPSDHLDHPHNYP